MRRKNNRIKREIMGVFNNGSIRTVNEIAREIHADWRTVKRHLDWLEKYKRKGKWKVRMIKKSKRLMLYQLIVNVRRRSKTRYKNKSANKDYENLF